MRLSKRTLLIAAVVVLATGGAFFGLGTSAPHNADRSAPKNSRPPPPAKALTIDDDQAPEPLAAPVVTSEVKRSPSQSGHTQSITIKFSDGLDVAIVGRPLPRSSILRPKQLKDIYAQLVELAKSGDSSAAYGLSRWLNECRYAHSTQAELDGAIARLLEEGLVTYPVSAPPPRSMATNDPNAEAALVQTFRFCDGITAEQRAGASAWLELGTGRGDLLALRARAQQLSPTQEEFFRSHLALWEQHGDMSALPALAAMYMRGISGAPQDYVRAYAYQLIQFKLNEYAYRDSVFPSHRAALQSMESSLAAIASYLTPDQTSKAVALAAQLVRQNPNCCVGRIFGTTN